MMAPVECRSAAIWGIVGMNDPATKTTRLTLLENVRKPKKSLYSHGSNPASETSATMTFFRRELKRS